MLIVKKTKMKKKRPGNDIANYFQIILGTNVLNFNQIEIFYPKWLNLEKMAEKLLKKLERNILRNF